MNSVCWILGSFFIGSLPTAYLMGRFLKGIDIRRVGSGNVGATNVFRTMGAGPGLITLGVDILKGLAPVLLCLRISPTVALPVWVGLAAVMGHTWSPFLGFKGGKGVATSAGVFLALMPIPAGIAIAVFIAVFAVSRHVSLGSLAGAAVLPVAAFALTGAGVRFGLALALSLLVILRHIPNIRRLLRGEEHSFQKKETNP